MWICPECTLQNEWDSTRCEVCTHRRPRSLWQRKRKFEKLQIMKTIEKKNPRSHSLSKKNESYINSKKKNEKLSYSYTKRQKQVKNFSETGFIVYLNQRKARQEIKLLETKYKKYTLDNVDNFLISNLLNSGKILLNCFGQLFIKKTKIIETFIQKIYKKIRLACTSIENKNLSILQKLLKGLQRLINFGIRIPLNFNIYLKLRTISKFKNLPLKVELN